MSAKQTGLVWELDLPHNEAWVLMAMADHADHEGHNVYPGVPLLAWKTGYATRQVRRILAVLQEKGLIVVEMPGGGRRTTRYRLELSQAAKKDPQRAGDAPGTRVREWSDRRDDKMSPLRSAAPEASMSLQRGQNVSAARTELCHLNRQGRKKTESSEPPPSALPPPEGFAAGMSPLPIGEGGRESMRHDGSNGEDSRRDGSLVQEMEAACAVWASSERLTTRGLELFRRQAQRLADGQDAEAWTHPQNGVVVPAEDRLRILGLGLRHLGDGTSQTLRGGVMYAVAKHYRVPPPVPATEHAAVVARGAAEDRLGRSPAHPPAATPTSVGILLSGQVFGPGPEVDPVEAWERNHVEECARLREQVAREIAADVGTRQISERTLRAMGQAQYRHRVLQGLHNTSTENGVASRLKDSSSNCGPG